LSCLAQIAHDPEKCEAVFPRDKRLAFARRSCANKNQRPTPPVTRVTHAREKGRPVARTAFPVSRRRPHLTGDFRTSEAGGLSPGGVLIGGRCLSGRSRFRCPIRRDGLPSP
jgi:hypothetical protein